MRSTDYALLDSDSYNTPSPEGRLEANGITYQVFAYADNPHTGFQATAYERPDTHEVIIAFRGTDIGGNHRADGLRDCLVDAGMVVADLNAQSPGAIAFTHEVIEQARRNAELGG